MRATLTDELLDLTASTRGRGGAAYAWEVTLCCCCSCCCQ